MDAIDIATVDLERWRAGDAAPGLAAAVDEALRATGFLVVHGHGMAADLAAELRARALEFFHLPAEVKTRYASGSGVPGWHRLRSEASGKVYGIDGPPDLREAVMFVTVGGTTLVDAHGPFAARNVDVPEVPGLVASAERYIAANEQLTGSLLALLASALGDTEQRLRAGMSRAMASLSINWYPPMDYVGSVLPGQFRVGPHADYGTITILDRQPGVGSLQVQGPDGSWIAPPYEPGTVIVNVGDLLQHWTGGRWRSTMHRVLPPDPTAPTEELTSLVYFVETDVDATIEVLPPPIGGGATHEPVVGADWLRERLAAVAVG